MILPRDKKLQQRSAKLRKEATPQEMRLWYGFLRTYPIRCNRQRIIGEYIVDFYCAKARLVIELDGSQHYEKDAVAYDTVRTEYFAAMGLEVLRFSNRDIRDNFDGVCMMIDQTIKARIPKAP